MVRVPFDVQWNSKLSDAQLWLHSISSYLHSSEWHTNHHFRACQKCEPWHPASVPDPFRNNGQIFIIRIVRSILMTLKRVYCYNYWNFHAQVLQLSATTVTKAGNGMDIIQLNQKFHNFKCVEWYVCFCCEECNYRTNRIRMWMCI